MFRGKIVELGSSDDVYNNPIHTYTKSLISAVPVPDPEHKKTQKVVMDENYLRSPVGTWEEVSNILPDSGLIEVRPNHWVEKEFMDL